MGAVQPALDGGGGVGDPRRLHDLAGRHRDAELRGLALVGGERGRLLFTASSERAVGEVHHELPGVERVAEGVLAADRGELDDRRACAGHGVERVRREVDHAVGGERRDPGDRPRYDDRGHQLVGVHVLVAGAELVRDSKLMASILSAGRSRRLPASEAGGRRDAGGAAAVPRSRGSGRPRRSPGFGSYVTTIALQVLVVVTLHGTASDVGLLNGARWLPYLVLGLVVGALVDRRPRKPVLVATDLGDAACCSARSRCSGSSDRLTLPLLLAFMVGLRDDVAAQRRGVAVVPAPAGGTPPPAGRERPARPDPRRSPRRPGR